MLRVAKMLLRTLASAELSFYAGAPVQTMGYHDEGSVFEPGV